MKKIFSPILFSTFCCDRSADYLKGGKKTPIIKTQMPKNKLLLLTWSFLLFRKQTPSPTPLGNNN